MNSNVDLIRLKELRQTLENLKKQKSHIKAQSDAIQEQAIKTLLEMGVTHVDESGNGQGPFWTITKDKSDGSFSKERYMRFFDLLLRRMQSDQTFVSNITPEACTTMAIQFLKQFQKRRLVLSRLRQCRSVTVGELQRWLDVSEQ